VTDHLSPGTTSHGPLGPLTNLSSKHIKAEAAYKINIQPRQKANNFKLKRVTDREQRGEREREHTSPRRLASSARVQAWGVEARAPVQAWGVGLTNQSRNQPICFNRSRICFNRRRSASTGAESASTGADLLPFSLSLSFEW
jgi:hypothetical protein